MSDHLLLAKIFDDIEAADGGDHHGKKMIGLWLPEGYKDRFDILQDKTNKDFGKRVQELVMQAIDMVDEKL